VYEPIKKQKSPKVLADALAWIETTLVEFGVAGIGLKELIGFVKVCGLTNTNANVRNCAVKLVTG
jgi:cytoskeleton-associated protein 5